MKKAPEAFRTISEVSEVLDTPAHVLRFWESKFYQVRPVKRAGGRRYYRPDDLALIAGIKHLLQDRGMTIRGVQKILQEEGVRHVIGIGRTTEWLEADADLGAGDAIEVDAVEPAAQHPAESQDPAARLPAAQPAEPADPPAPVDASPAAADQPIPAKAATAPAPPSPAPTAPAAAGATRRPMPPPPDTAAEPDPDAPRFAQLLRACSRDAQPHTRYAPIAQRLDRLLDRMADASGTRRW